ncbi:MAG: hypothetical protein FGM24_06445 [Candidatus Kapabacteria bacterium]|nr:hypothetical protein [Candidatus Kapabacteria bacterium]
MSVQGLAEGANLETIAGQVIDIVINVKNPTAAAAGINIAVKTEQNGTTSAGTLMPFASSGLRLQGGELAHGTPKAFVGGEVVFAVRWTAPSEPGTYYLHAVSNAVNRNGAPDIGDQWNWMQPVKIVVGTPSSVADAATIEYSSLDLRPLPAHGDVSMQIPSELTGETFTLSIIDGQGAVVYQREVQPGSAAIQQWDGRTFTGTHAAPGSYVVVLANDRRVLRGRAIIVR